MNTLFILNTLQESHIPEALQRIFGSDDALLLTGDGVYAVMSAREELPDTCYALESDVQARGLLPYWPADIALIDHGGFVDLCVQYGKSLSWS